MNFALKCYNAMLRKARCDKMIVRKSYVMWLHSVHMSKQRKTGESSKKTNANKLAAVENLLCFHSSRKCLFLVTSIDQWSNSLNVCVNYWATRSVFGPWTGNKGKRTMKNLPESIVFLWCQLHAMNAIIKLNIYVNGETKYRLNWTKLRLWPFLHRLLGNWFSSYGNTL